MYFDLTLSIRLINFHYSVINILDPIDFNTIVRKVVMSKTQTIFCSNTFIGVDSPDNTRILTALPRNDVLENPRQKIFESLRNPGYKPLRLISFSPALILQRTRYLITNCTIRIDDFKTHYTTF